MFLNIITVFLVPMSDLRIHLTTLGVFFHVNLAEKKSIVLSFNTWPHTTAHRCVVHGCINLTTVVPLKFFPLAFIAFHFLLAQRVKSQELDSNS